MELMQQVWAFVQKEDGYDSFFRAMMAALTPEQHQELETLAESTKDAMVADKLHIQPLPKKTREHPTYMPETKLETAFFEKGKKRSTRQEIVERLPYLSYDVQRRLLHLLLNSGKGDRVFAINYLNDHWDEQFEDEVIRLFEQYHDWQAARVVCRYAPVRYVEDHLYELRKYYVRARARMPKDAPIKLEWLSRQEYLYLAAKLGLDLTQLEIKALFVDELLSLMQVPKEVTYSDQENIMCNEQVRILLWCLGQLHCVETILWFYEFYHRTLQIERQNRREAILQELNTLSSELHEKIFKGEYPMFTYLNL